MSRDLGFTGEFDVSGDLILVLLLIGLFSFFLLVSLLLSLFLFGFSLVLVFSRVLLE